MMTTKMMTTKMTTKMTKTNKIIGYTTTFAALAVAVSSALHGAWILTLAWALVFAIHVILGPRMDTGTFLFNASIAAGALIWAIADIAFSGHTSMALPAVYWITRVASNIQAASMKASM